MNDPERKLEELNRQNGKMKNAKLKLIVDKEFEVNNSKYEADIKSYKKGIPIPDKETEKDLLNRSIYSKTIGEYIINKKIESPFNTGIFAQWGAGKSSFLKLIKNEINKKTRKMRKSNNLNVSSYMVDSI
jgi:ABC-type transport system involved in cytochrome bd biosynthesis fused ATPase/permease subunit